LVKPSAVTMCKAYYEMKPCKICYMRFDSLAQILHLGNIQANSTVIVVDNCAGLLVGAIAERLGGHGKILAIHEGPQSSYPLVEVFNFSPEVKKSIYSFPLTQIRSVKDYKPSEEVESMEVEKQIDEKKAKLEEAKGLIAAGADSIVISSKYEPYSILSELLPYLALSRPFVMFGNSAQPLADCYDKLLKQKSALNLDLSETWMRVYQVLPDRTHSMMNMNAASGYVLSGTKVEPL